MILGAFGCGVSGFSSDEAALAFKKMLKNDKSLNGDLVGRYRSK
jgi:hypothetical protein